MYHVTIVSVLYVTNYVFVNGKCYPVCTMYISDPETVKLKLAHFKFGVEPAKPSGVVPIGRTAKVSTNIQLVRTASMGPEWISSRLHQQHAQ